jgi:hypothetical protein
MRLVSPAGYLIFPETRWLVGYNTHRFDNHHHKEKIMLREHCTVGMKVMFGRGNGEQTLGEIIKINPTKAKVKTLQTRGNGRGSSAGAIWTVPYSLMNPAGVAFIDELNSLPPLDSAELPLPYNEFSEMNLIVEAVVQTYNHLSPEWLTCDGELPRTRVIARKIELERRLKGLFMALGRPVSESVAYKWEEERCAASAKKSG